MNQTKTFFTLRTAVLTLLSSAICSLSFAQGDLLVFPKRVLFEGSKRTQEINLSNSGSDTARYVISVVQIRMKENGAFETITEPDPGQHFADRYFRIFPRTVVLPPNEAQTVKIQLSNTGDMKPGEYRSHLYLRAEEEKKPLGEEQGEVDSSAISIELKAVFGITIPVIIRNGDYNAALNISDLALKHDRDQMPYLTFCFNRSGDMSLYGDVLVNHIAPDGKSTRVGIMNGLAVYAPTAKRYITLPLAQNTGLDYHKGSLQLKYTYNNGKSDKVLEETLVLR